MLEFRRVLFRSPPRGGPAPRHFSSFLPSAPALLTRQGCSTQTPHDTGTRGGLSRRMRHAPAVAPAPDIASVTTRFNREASSTGLVCCSPAPIVRRSPSSTRSHVVSCCCAALTKREGGGRLGQSGGAGRSGVHGLKRRVHGPPHWVVWQWGRACGRALLHPLIHLPTQLCFTRLAVVCARL